MIHNLTLCTTHPQSYIPTSNISSTWSKPITPLSHQKTFKHSKRKPSECKGSKHNTLSQYITNHNYLYKPQPKPIAQRYTSLSRVLQTEPDKNEKVSFAQFDRKFRPRNSRFPRVRRVQRNNNAAAIVFTFARPRKPAVVESPSMTCFIIRGIKRVVSVYFVWAAQDTAGGRVRFGAVRRWNATESTAAPVASLLLHCSRCYRPQQATVTRLLALTRRTSFSAVEIDLNKYYLLDARRTGTSRRLPSPLPSARVAHSSRSRHCERRI